MKTELPVVDEVSQTCESCQWWKLEQAYINNNNRGFCHRYAPRPCDKYKEVYWPQTNHNDFCGEWQKKEEAPASCQGSIRL